MLFLGGLLAGLGGYVPLYSRCIKVSSEGDTTVIHGLCTSRSEVYKVYKEIVTCSFVVTLPRREEGEASTKGNSPRVGYRNEVGETYDMLLCLHHN